MSRGEGFQNADHDTRFLRDVKLRRLRREAGSDGEGAVRTVLYLAVRDSSWAEGERVAIEDADCPYPVTPKRILALQAAGLLDAEGRIPLEAWDGWFRPAWERRDKLRTAGRIGSDRRWAPHSQGHSPPESPPEWHGTPNGNPRYPSVPLPVKRSTTTGTSTTQDSQGTKPLEPRARPRRSPTNGPVDPMETKG